MNYKKATQLFVLAIVILTVLVLVLPDIGRKIIPASVKESIRTVLEIEPITKIEMDTVLVERLGRETVANVYIRGNGIEIGALHLPTKVPETANVKYLDILPLDELKKHYPDLLEEYELVNVDIVDDGEYLVKIGDNTQDFVIANHFLEHCQNPIVAVENMLRVLKPGGILFMSVPDMRYTFDIDRPVTTFEHLLDHYKNGPGWLKKEHYEEWVRMVNRTTDEEDVKEQVAHLMNMNYSIHFHVWSQIEINDFIIRLKTEMNFKFNLELMVQTQERENEVVFILKKIL